MKATWWLLALLAVLLESCMPSSSKETKSLPFNVQPGQSQWAVGDRPAYLIVTDRNWSTYYSNPPSGSDFGRFIYAVASPGVKPNAGYTVSIQRLELVKDAVTVRVELNEPDPRKMYAQVLVYPIAVAAIARAELGPPYPSSFVFVDQKGRRLARVKTNIQTEK